MYLNVIYIKKIDICEWINAMIGDFYTDVKWFLRARRSIICVSFKISILILFLLSETQVYCKVQTSRHIIKKHKNTFMVQNSYLNTELPYYPHLKKNRTKRSIYERYLNGAIEYIYHGTSEANIGGDDLDTFISKRKSSHHGKNSIHSTSGSKEKTSSKYEYMEGYTVTHHASNEHELSYMTNIFNYYS